MSENPFIRVYMAGHATDARQLMIAFQSVHTRDYDPDNNDYVELCTALRAIGRLTGHTDRLFGYLMGCHFEEWQDSYHHTLETDRVYELQCLAHDFELWMLDLAREVAS